MWYFIFWPFHRAVIENQAHVCPKSAVLIENQGNFLAPGLMLLGCQSRVPLETVEDHPRASWMHHPRVRKMYLRMFCCSMLLTAQWPASTFTNRQGLEPAIPAYENIAQNKFAKQFHTWLASDDWRIPENLMTWTQTSNSVLSATFTQRIFSNSTEQTRNFTKAKWQWSLFTTRTEFEHSHQRFCS